MPISITSNVQAGELFATFHFADVFREFKLEVATLKTIRAAVIPRSGYVPKLRVDSTLGAQVDILLNRNGLRRLDATALRLKLAIQFITQDCRTQRQPWALRHNRFAATPELSFDAGVARANAFHQSWEIFLLRLRMFAQRATNQQVFRPG